MKVVKKVGAVVCMCISKIFYCMVVACTYACNVAQSCADSLNKVDAA